MLTNIFLFKCKYINDLNQLDIYSYPDDLIEKDSKNHIRKILFGHDQGYYLELIRNTRETYSNLNSSKKNSNPFHIEAPVPQFIDNSNVYSACINGNIFIGLKFENYVNPYDYKEIFEELLNELLNVEKICSFEEEFEIENLLLTMFIDIRRFGDEYIDKKPITEFPYQESFTKVFLWGLDDVGKSSLVRRIKTGEYNDNYLLPTKKFSIEYVQEDNKNLLAFWDMPGQRSFRKKWLIGLQDSNIIVFMIDVANQLRFEESKTEFWKIINRYDLIGIPLIILANKIDLFNQSNNMNDEHCLRLQNEIIEYFEFEKIENRDWKLIFTSVKTNYNIDTVKNSIFHMI